MKTIEPSTTAIDPVLSEVRKHKNEIAETFGFDVVALGRSLQKRQEGDTRFVSIKGKQDMKSSQPTQPTSGH